jgi:23S rRNA G2445 N2-methylase RlmL
MAKALPVWAAGRRPSLAGMPAFDAVEPTGDTPLFADAQPRIIASELRPDLSSAIERGAETVGVHEHLKIFTCDFRELSPRELRAQDRPATLILTNPPYGERLATGDLPALYRDLGRFCARFPGQRAAFLVANPEFEAAFGGRPRIKKPINNGPLRGYFYLYEL